ncbi:hypothetical protein L596_024326 [Steinernema carpocapsae]|uniref:RanBD1 domain-containing protein n=1 Tax=Steinernema carpocapsae TaxID=34508 RepID=A0A4U5MGF7_STECR|nr:hypothetical protein L596_024326 [Steinernema carpocapsae]
MRSRKSPTVRDYLKHVTDLDNIYAKPSDPKKRRTDSEGSKGILKANGTTPKENGSASKKVTFTDDAEKERAERVRSVLEKEATAKMDEEPKTKSNFKPEALRVNRKRSKFGGEDDDRSETVTFKGKGGGASSSGNDSPVVIPESLTKAQSQGASFWKPKATTAADSTSTIDSVKKDESSPSEAAPKTLPAFGIGTSPFGFASKPASQSTPSVESEKKGDGIAVTEAPKVASTISSGSSTFFGFGSKSSTPGFGSSKADPTKKAENSSAPEPTMTTASPFTPGFFSFGAKTAAKPLNESTLKIDSEKDDGSSSSLSSTGDLPKPGPVFGSSSSVFSLGPKPSSLDSSVSEAESDKKGEGNAESEAPKPISLFGGPAPVFAFAKPPAESTSQSNSEKKDEEGVDDAPPVVEAVVNEEPGTVHMVKCGVHLFKNKAYTKLGLGMLYLKKEFEDLTEDEPEIFLMRAATATGTVWANARLKNVTGKSVNDVKITIQVPNTEGVMQTLLIKFPNATEATKVLDYISKK